MTRFIFILDIKDIKPPVYFPANRFLLAALLSLVVLTAAFFLITWLKNRLKRKMASKEALKTPDQLARESLTALRAENLIAQGKIKEYFIRLSDIVRRYIEGRFNIRAPEMTTEEFLYSLNNSGILASGHKKLLKEFLTLCDIVKFARYAPARDEADGSFDLAVKLVEETKPTFENSEEAN